jgi:hypothetical protein
LDKSSFDTIGERSRLSRTVERQLVALEDQYNAILLSALRACAAGRNGLFGHNDRAIAGDSPAMRRRLSNPSVGELLDLGSRIERLRLKLGVTDPFAPHERLMRMRASCGDNTLGEPKLAQRWLDESSQQP